MALRNLRIRGVILLAIINGTISFPVHLLQQRCYGEWTETKYNDGSTGEYSESYGHTVIVRVVRVTPDWVRYTDTGGWPQAATIKESEYLKYFEVAIWEETASIHLYEFPNDYDWSYGYRGNTTDDENIAYREQFALEVFTGLPGTDHRDERSEFTRNAFYSFIDIICDRYQESHHGLTFSGHGRPGGALFDASLAPKHVQDMLLYWANRIGKKLAFIDMGGPCNKGGYTDLNTCCPYCEYYIGSDLTNGGYTFDDWTYEKYLETNPDDRYHDLMAGHASLIEILKARIDIKRTAYEYSRNNMIQNKVEQSQYLYSSENFKEFYDAIEADGEVYPSRSDLYSFIREDVFLRDLFNSVIAHKADNRDFFDWEVEANGILTPNTLNGVFSDALLSIKYPVLDFGPDVDPDRGTASFEGFEAGDFGAFDWSSYGDADWTVSSTASRSGAYSAQAGAIDHDESSSLRVSLDCLSGYITFYHKVSSESYCDELIFKIDGVEKGAWSGQEDWLEVSFPVNEGTRTFEWTYSKDSSVSEGDDTVWIDDIIFPIGP